MPILPTSWRTLAWRSSSASASLMPTARPSASHMRLMRSMCTPVSSSRDSAACARRWTISSWVSRSSAVRARTISSSTSFSPVTRRRSRLSSQ